jgi:hypothetical protein
MMKQNMSLKKCLNANEEIASSTNNNIYEPLWFIYYMFFAIHNPKMEEYIQKKTQRQHTPQHTPHIIKNMIKRRNYTSTIVFQLYTHAYTNDGNVSYIYPKDNDNALIKSYQSNHLKTTAVHLRRHYAAATPAATPAVVAFVEYMMTTKSIYSTIMSPIDVLGKINHNINYNNKDIIILALLCYMKLDEDDINQKNIFIAATTDEINQEHDDATAEPEIPSTSPSPYDEKYKYLYT